MKFLVAIAMVALIGFSFTSAAAIDMGEDITPESMEGFEENLQNMLHEVSRQIKESANFDDMEKLESFIQETKVDNGGNDEQAYVVTEAEENLSAIEEDTSNENVDSGKTHCVWHGKTGACCKIITVGHSHIPLCVAISIYSSTRLLVSLYVSRHRFWTGLVDGHHKYRLCVQKGAVKLCFHLYGLTITSHYFKICVIATISVGSKKILVHIGCITKHHASDEISATAEKVRVSVLPVEELEKGKRLLTAQKEEKLIDKILRFNHSN